MRCLELALTPSCKAPELKRTRLARRRQEQKRPEQKLLEQKTPEQRLTRKNRLLLSCSLVQRSLQRCMLVRSPQS